MCESIYHNVCDEVKERVTNDKYITLLVVAIAYHIAKFVNLFTS